MQILIQQVREGLGPCIPNKLPGDADASGGEIALCVARFRPSGDKRFCSMQRGQGENALQHSRSSVRKAEMGVTINEQGFH